MKENLLEKIIASLVFLSVLAGVNMFITNKLIDNAITEYALNLPQTPKPIVVDMDEMVRNLTSEGLEPIDVIVHTQTLNALLVKEGYLVFDKKDVLSYHPRYALQPIPNDKLLASAKKAGIDFEGPARKKMEEALSQGKKMIDEMIGSQ